jgi:hypothetical protein
LVVTWSGIVTPSAESFHCQDKLRGATLAVKQNLYSVKIAAYKDSHGKNLKRKQSEPSSSGEAAQAGEGCVCKARQPGAPVEKRSAVSPR